jgi:hypothetical protein
MGLPWARLVFDWQFWGAAVEFSSNQNTLPEPTVLSTPITPPISSTSRLLITRPMPVPSSALLSCPGD